LLPCLRVNRTTENEPRNLRENIGKGSESYKAGVVSDTVGTPMIQANDSINFEVVLGSSAQIGEVVLFIL
jgi:Na+/H+-translocating membrane pyrophosphatase